MLGGPEKKEGRRKGGEGALISDRSTVGPDGAHEVERRWGKDGSCSQACWFPITKEKEE